MSRIGICSLFIVLFGIACGGHGGTRGASDARQAAVETCSSVVRAGTPDGTTEQLERASNVLDYERVWRDANPGNTPGTISGAEVRARIRANAGEIRGCYEAALERLPAGQGRVAVRFIVDASGSVPAVSISSNDFNDPEVGCCVAKRVAAWRFPAPTDGAFVVVEYPFVVRTSTSSH